MTEANRQNKPESTVLSVDQGEHQKQTEQAGIRFRSLISFVMMLTQLFFGVAAGYLAYMRGIQTCDWIPISNFFVLLPVMWFLIHIHSATKSLLWWPILLNPFIFLLGFWLSYRYPHSLKGAWLFSGYSLLCH